MIEFNCTKCNQKFTVPPAHAGKMGKCHKCGSIVVIPAMETVDPSRNLNTIAAENNKSSDSFVPELRLKEEKEEPRVRQINVIKSLTPDFHTAKNSEPVINMDISQTPSAERSPSIVDIFLYPTSTAGLINLGIYWILPILLGLIQRLLPIPLVWGLVSIVITGSLLYYLMTCIRDSASGGTKAPDNLTNIPDISDATTQVMEIVAVAILFWGPVAFYTLFTHKTDILFWLLLGYGVFFFPMGFLCLAMFNSTSAFNPFLWIASIFSTFFQYCGLVLFFCLLAWLIGRIVSSFSQALLFAYFYSAIFIYFAMVACHLLGRFYYINSKKLNWEV